MKIKYKTNIHCDGCLKAITPFLNDLNNVDSWKVDLENKDKILEVNLDDENDIIVEIAIKKAGFEIEKI